MDKERIFSALNIRPDLLYQSGKLHWSYAKDNIRANILCPSTVETPLVQEMMKNPERRQERLGEVPLGRLASMEDVAGVALYLATAASRHGDLGSKLARSAHFILTPFSSRNGSRTS